MICMFVISRLAREHQLLHVGAGPVLQVILLDELLGDELPHVPEGGRWSASSRAAAPGRAARSRWRCLWRRGPSSRMRLRIMSRRPVRTLLLLRATLSSSSGSSAFTNADFMVWRLDSLGCSLVSLRGASRTPGRG